MTALRYGQTSMPFSIFDYMVWWKKNKAIEYEKMTYSVLFDKYMYALSTQRHKGMVSADAYKEYRKEAERWFQDRQQEGTGWIPASKGILDEAMSYQVGDPVTIGGVTRSPQSGWITNSYRNAGVKPRDGSGLTHERAMTMKACILDVVFSEGGQVYTYLAPETFEIKDTPYVVTTSHANNTTAFEFNVGRVSARNELIDNVYEGKLSWIVASFSDSEYKRRAANEQKRAALLKAAKAKIEAITQVTQLRQLANGDPDALALISQIEALDDQA